MLGVPPLDSRVPVLKRRWPKRLAVLAGLIAIVVEFRAKKRRLVLEDGRTLTLVNAIWVQPGGSHVLANPNNNRVTRAWGELIGKPRGNVAGGGVGFDRDYRALGLWFHLPGGWTADDAVTKYPVLTDANGWKHQGLFFYSVNGGGKPQVLCEIPTVPRANEQCRIDVVTSDGKIVGGMNYTMPPDTKPFFLWTASPLPITTQDGEMSVTLKSISADNTRGYNFTIGSGVAYPPSYRIHPELTVEQNGQPTSDWEICDDSWWQTRKRPAPIRNTSGERSSIDRCQLSPYDDVWHFDLALVKKSAALPPEQKIEFQCKVPAANNSAVMNEVQKLGPVSISSLGVAGAGNSTVTAAGPRFYMGGQSWPLINFPQRKVTLSWQELPGSSNSVTSFSPTTQSDSYISEEMLRPSQVSLSFQQPVQAIVLNASPWKSEHLQMEVFDDQGRQIAGQKMRFLEVALWMPELPLPPEAQAVTVRVSIQEPRHLEFFVAPPRQAILDYLAQKNSADVTSAMGEIPSTPGAGGTP